MNFNKSSRRADNGIKNTQMGLLKYKLLPTVKKQSKV